MEKNRSTESQTLAPACPPRRSNLSAALPVEKHPNHLLNSHEVADMLGVDVSWAKNHCTVSNRSSHTSSSVSALQRKGKTWKGKASRQLWSAAQPNALESRLLSGKVASTTEVMTTLLCAERRKMLCSSSGRCGRERPAEEGSEDGGTCRLRGRRES